MRLFHISEEENIDIFIPRIPLRNDMDKNVGLVWAVDEKRLPNFLLPRDCPRVCYHIGEHTSQQDKIEFFTSGSSAHTVVVEHRWVEQILNTTLYRYEFSIDDFELQDSVAGYWVAKTEQRPIAKVKITNLLSELAKYNVELRIVDELFTIAERVKVSTLNWSLCRMKNAKK